MNSGQMNKIAAFVPMTIEELSDCDLPENVRKQYGERLVKSINAYVESQNLHSYIENRPKKKQKTVVEPTESKPVLIDVPDSDEAEDEFDDGIDYSQIQIPGQEEQDKANPPQKSNPYDQKPAAKPTGARKGSKLKSSRKSSYF